MQHQVIELDSRGIAHAVRTLGAYLPGLSMGLVPIGARRLLVPASTVRALSIQYGSANVSAILAKAGATGAVAVDDSGAIALLRARDPETLPSRSAARVEVAGIDWHLARVNAPAAWSMLGGPDAIDWGSVRVGHIDTGYTRHPVFGFDTTPWIDESLARTFFAGETPMDDPGPGNGIDPPNAITSKTSVSTN